MMGGINAARWCNGYDSQPSSWFVEGPARCFPHPAPTNGPPPSLCTQALWLPSPKAPLISTSPRSRSRSSGQSRSPTTNVSISRSRSRSRSSGQSRSQDTNDSRSRLIYHISDPFPPHSLPTHPFVIDEANVPFPFLPHAAPYTSVLDCLRATLRESGVKGPFQVRPDRCCGGREGEGRGRGK